jgi:xanthosine utilization system XapX-like protein
MKTLLSIVVGIVLGVLFHYLLYRFSLPAKPFIYVAF